MIFDNENGAEILLRFFSFVISFYYTMYRKAKLVKGINVL